MDARSHRGGRDRTANPIAFINSISQLPLFGGREATCDLQRRPLRLQVDRFLNQARADDDRGS